MVSKTFIEKIIAGVLASNFLLPALALAEESATTTPTPRDTSAFCTNLPSIRAKALTRLTDRVTEVQGKKSEHQTKFETGRTERHTKLATGRTEHDATRQARYEKLRSRASTTEQTTAVTTFATEVERLVVVRKAAVDVAIKTFEDAVLVLQTANNAKVADFGTTMRADMSKVFDDAAASCSAGKTGPEVMAQVKTAMEAKRAARDAEKATRVPGEQFKALQAARVASVEAAKATFRTSYDAAAVELKKAFAK